MGHFGSESVVKSILSEGLYWNTIYKDVKNTLLTCKPCAYHNIVRKGYNPLKSVVAWEPFSHVSMDLCGPFDVTTNGNVYILVVMDICTRYIIARPIKNKQSDTVAQALMDIFGDYGVPRVCIQSDNGTEFKNSLMTRITKALGIQHRFSNPYYPQSNGLAEYGVKMIVSTIRKLCNNDSSNWDEKVALAQLCINTKFRYKSGSTPYSLMFARQYNKLKDYSDPKNKAEIPKKPTPIEELEKRIGYMNEIVFPAIKERTQKILEEYEKKFNKKHYIIDIPVGTAVMVRLPHRASKLSVLYEGPYIVHHKTQANNYVLKTENNELLHRDYTPSELKIVSIDETAIEDELFEVEDIRDHRDNENGEKEYLVKWAGYGERENSWVPASFFSTPIPISKYWKKVDAIEALEKERKANLVAKNDKSTTKKITVQNKVNSSNKNNVMPAKKRGRPRKRDTINYQSKSNKKGPKRKANENIGDDKSGSVRRSKRFRK
jgi:transposase InsO family protein